MKEKFNYIKYLIGGILFIGGILDSVSNAFEFFTTKISLSLTIAVIFIYVSINLYLKYIRPRFDKTTNTRITEIGIETKLLTLGVLIIFWIPIISKSFHKEKCFDIISNVTLNFTKKQRLNDLFGSPIYDNNDFYDENNSIGIWKTDNYLVESHYNTQSNAISYLAIKLLNGGCIETFKKSFEVGNITLDKVRGNKYYSDHIQDGINNEIPSETYLTWSKSDTDCSWFVYKYYFEFPYTNNLMLIIGYHENDKIDGTSAFQMWFEGSRDDKTLLSNTMILIDKEEACL